MRFKIAVWLTFILRRKNLRAPETVYFYRVIEGGESIWEVLSEG